MLDASALIAWLRNEPGADVVQRALDAGSVINAVNLAEVLTRFHDIGVAGTEVLGDLQLAGVTTLSYGEDDAQQTADLRAATRSGGLSLGDRACLALAIRLGQPALTADRAWAPLNVGAQVELIR